MKEFEISYKPKEFDENCALNGDMYLYDNGKLVFMCNAVEEPKKTSLFARIRHYLFCKRNGIVINLDRRTLEYIYNCCKGVMPMGPMGKEKFVKAVLRTIPYRTGMGDLEFARSLGYFLDKRKLTCWDWCTMLYMEIIWYTKYYWFRVFHKRKHATRRSVRNVAFKQGYHQAEKDLALMWKDVHTIAIIEDKLIHELCLDDQTLPQTQEFYQEVLKRFNKTKEK